jgi:hypothetical protein
MTERVRLEAVFVTATAGPDGQHLVEGLGTFVAMEPASVGLIS